MHPHGFEIPGGADRAPPPENARHRASGYTSRHRSHGLRPQYRPRQNTGTVLPALPPGEHQCGQSPKAGVENKNGLIKPLEPSKAAEIIINGMEKNKARIFVGTDVKVMDLLYRINPGFAMNLIRKQMKSHIPE